MSRVGEANKKYFRTARVVLINDHWYYMSRENAPKGPYATREDADEAVSRYAKLVRSKFFDAAELKRINALEM